MTSINTHARPHKKQILADPLKHLNLLQEDKNDQDKVQIQHLRDQNITLKHQIDELQLESKKLSRKIGEAKQNNQNIDDLKKAMRELSQSTKDKTLLLADSEEKLLSFFRLSNTRTKNPENLSVETNYGKRKYTDKVNIDEISITLFDHDHQAWNNYVDNNPAGCLHHRIEWLQLIQESYQHECLYFTAKDIDNKIVGILPLVHLKSRLFGDLLVSMPYFQRAGVLADHPLIEQALMNRANQQAANLGIQHIEYRDDIERENMLVQSHKVNMVLPLPKSSDILWQGFSSKLRAQIKRPQRENPETQFGREELLDEFYTVYSRNMRDLGSPVHAKSFIASILRHLPDNSYLVIVNLKQRPVGAALLLTYKDTMEIPLASTIRSVNHLSINMLLYWQILQFAVENGYKYFDFGRSTRGAGTYRFKRQWGAIPQTLYWHYWLNDGQSLPGLNPSNPKYAVLIKIWKRLPLVLSNKLGPMIVKNLP